MENNQADNGPKNDIFSQEHPREELKNQEYLLTKEQHEIYQWLIKQELNTDHQTLNYWSRVYPEQRLKDVVNFANRRIANGEKIRNIGGWVHKLLKTALAVVNEISQSNRAFAQNFTQRNKWTEL